jgi:hypothetical protein
LRELLSVVKTHGHSAACGNTRHTHRHRHRSRYINIGRIEIAIVGVRSK